MDIGKIICILGASLPVVAVGGAIALNKVMDPPEEPMFIRRPRSVEEARRFGIARSLCAEGANILIMYAHDIINIADSIDALSLDRASIELEEIAKLIEFDLGKLSEEAERLGRNIPEVRDAVRSAFPPKLGGDIARFLRIMAKEIRESRPDPMVLRNSLEVLGNTWIKSALDSYCECLARAGATCTSHQTVTRPPI